MRKKEMEEHRVLLILWFVLCFYIHDCYGNIEQTNGLLKHCNKGVKINICEPSFIHALQTKFINGITEDQ
jgi:hypothetical protein